MRTLAIFDFDDTLFKSGARIIVKSRVEEDKFLSTHEYPLYIPTTDEIFDFSEFESFPPNPVQIVPVVEAFLRSISDFGIENVAILTARAHEAPVLEVLKSFNLPMVEVEAVGSSDPKAKSSFVNRRILEGGYGKVILYEDNVSNIQEICRAVESQLGSGSIDAFRVIDGSSILRVTRGRRGEEVSLRARQ